MQAREPGLPSVALQRGADAVAGHDRKRGRARLAVRLRQTAPGGAQELKMFSEPDAAPAVEQMQTHGQALLPGEALVTGLREQ